MEFETILDFTEEDLEKLESLLRENISFYAQDIIYQLRREFDKAPNKEFQAILNFTEEDLRDLEIAAKEKGCLNEQPILFQLRGEFKKAEIIEQALYEEFKAEYKSRKYRCSNTCPTWNPEDRDCEIYGSNHPKVWQCPYEFAFWKKKERRENDT